jgi:hypothetical protein
MLFKEIIAVRNEELLTVEAGGSYSYRWDLKG